jgi:hypothetical protein
MIADLKYITILTLFCSKNKKKYLPLRGEPAPQSGGWGKVKKKKADSKGTSFFQIKIILIYKLKSARVSGYSLLSTFALISLKALIVYSTSSRVWAAVGIRRSMTTSLGTTG